MRQLHITSSVFFVSIFVNLIILGMRQQDVHRIVLGIVEILLDIENY